MSGTDTFNDANSQSVQPYMLQRYKKSAGWTLNIARESVDLQSSNHPQSERGKWLAAFPCRIRKAGQPQTFQVRLNAPYLPIRKCPSPPALAGRYSALLFAQCPCLINPPGGDKGEGDGLICFPVLERCECVSISSVNKHRAEEPHQIGTVPVIRILQPSPALADIQKFGNGCWFHATEHISRYSTRPRYKYAFYDWSFALHHGVLGTGACTSKVGLYLFISRTLFG